MGRYVLIKPNLVEDLPGPVGTHPALIKATARCFLSLGAKQVTVGEGPGHQRDTEAILISTGVGAALESAGVRFVDLNRDALSLVPLKTAFSGLNHLWLPQTVLASDIVVSMPKVKTHHWAGATLSLTCSASSRARSMAGPRTSCTGTVSIEASSISQQPFRFISPSPMESSPWREMGRCSAPRANSIGSSSPTIRLQQTLPVRG